MDDWGDIKHILLAQQQQLEVLGDLGNMVVRAHFAIREHHEDLCSHVRCLCDVLDRAGVISRHDLHGQLELRRHSLLLLKALERPEVAWSVAQALGPPCTQAFRAVSRRCAESPSGPPWRPPAGGDLELPDGEGEPQRAPAVEPAADGQQPPPLADGQQPLALADGLRPLALADAQRRPPLAAGQRPLALAGARGPPLAEGRRPLALLARAPLAEAGGPLEHLLEAEEEPLGAGAGEGRGCRELLQDLWQDSSLADVLTCVMDPASIGRFRAVSRAGRECLRALRDPPAKRKRPPAPEEPADAPRELRASRKPALLRRAGEAPAQQPGAASGNWTGGGCLALLQDIWQYPMLAEALTCTMGASTVSRFRATSRGGRECMRECHARGACAEPPGSCAPHGARGIAEERRAGVYVDLAGERPPAPKGRLPRVPVSALPVSALVRASPPAAAPAGARRAERAAVAALQAVPEEGALQPERREAGEPSTRVVVRGLSSRYELNGCAGELRTRFGPRWLVLLDTGKYIRVHEKHLERQEAERREAETPLAVPESDVPSELRKAFRRARKKSHREPAGDSACEHALQLPRVLAGLRLLLRLLDVQALSLLSVRISHAVIQPVLCMIGGIGADGKGIGVPECLRPGDSRWTAMPQLKWKRFETQVVQCAGSIYAIGGRDHHSRSLGLVERLDAWSEGWQPMPPLCTARCFCSVAAIAGGICVAGGFSDKRKHLCSTEWFSPGRGTWQVMQDMAESRSWAASAVVDGRTLFICGGITMNVLRSVERLEFIGRPDAASASWRWVPPMQKARICATAVHVRGFLYVLGGTDAKASLSSMERLWLASNATGSSRGELWEALPTMSVPRVGAAVTVTSKGVICVCGGCTLRGPGCSHHQTAECFDPSTCVWQDLPPMMHGRSCAGYGVMAGRLYVMGGQSNDHVHLRDAECLDLQTFRWEPLPAMQYDRLAPSSLVLRS